MRIVPNQDGNRLARILDDKQRRIGVRLLLTTLQRFEAIAFLCICAERGRPASGPVGPDMLEFCHRFHHITLTRSSLGMSESLTRPNVYWDECRLTYQHSINKLHSMQHELQRRLHNTGALNLYILQVPKPGCIHNGSCSNNRRVRACRNSRYLFTSCAFSYSKLVNVSILVCDEQYQYMHV